MNPEKDFIVEAGGTFESTGCKTYARPMVLVFGFDSWVHVSPSGN